MTELRAGVSLGGWTIVRLLASGGMGAVYVAKNSLSGVVRALKVVRPDLVANEDMRQRFLREVALASRVRHPNVVEAYDPLEIDGRILLPMELLEGQTLAARLRRGPLEIAETIDLGIVLARAAAAFHAIGIIHRDLKPANIFLARDASGVETPKILDLGAAREIQGPKHTQTGHTVGSPSYMAPEQARGDRELDGRVDVYALGVVLYIALTCVRPVDSDEQGNAIAKLVQGVEIVSPRHHRPDVPPALEAIVMRALAWDRARRFSSAEELAQALDELRKVSASPHPRADAASPRMAAPVSPPSVRPAEAAGHRPGRMRWAIGLLVASALCLALGAATFGVVWYASRAPAMSATDAPPPPPGTTTPGTTTPGTTTASPVEQTASIEPDAGVTQSPSDASFDGPAPGRSPSHRPHPTPATRGDDPPEPGTGLWLEDP